MAVLRYVGKENGRGAEAAQPPPFYRAEVGGQLVEVARGETFEVSDEQAKALVAELPGWFGEAKGKA